MNKGHISYRATGDRRLAGLDLIRASAILWVMLYHAWTMGLMSGAPLVVARFGWMGVDLFFVLSGYLIAGQLLRPLAHGLQPDYRSFFRRRLFRTLPAFIAILSLYFLVPQLRETPDISPFWQFATFTENLLFEPGSGKAFDQAWSLCVEEQFYLLFPLALLFLSRAPSAKKTICAILVIVAAGIVVRSFSFLAFVAERPFDASSASNWRSYVSLIYYPTWSRLDGLVAGVALATVQTFRPEVWRRLTVRPDILFAVGVCGILLAMILFGVIPTPIVGVAIGFPVLAVAVALVIAAAASTPSLRRFFWMPLAEIVAAGAYSLYLSHKMAFHVAKAWLAPALHVAGGAVAIVGFATALTMGALLYWSIERPFLLLRDGPRRVKRESVRFVRRSPLIRPAS